MGEKNDLLKLLRDNAETEFGRKHRFGGIHSIREYQEQVPLSRYPDYVDAINRMVAGERDVLTAYPLYTFATTSGSTGEPKKIPVTGRGLHAFSYLYRNVLKYVDGVSGRHLHLSVFRTVPGQADKTMLVMAAAYRNLYEKGIFRPEDYVGGLDFLFSREIGDVLFVKLWLAFSEERLVSIQSIFLYDILLFFEYMREHGTEVLRAMEKKTVPEGIRLSARLRNLLETDFCPPAERIRVLRRELGRGFDGIAPRLWRKLRLVSGIGGSFFSSREELLRRYTGAVPWHHFGYGSSECLCAYADGLNRPAYVLMPESGFFEFLDAESGRVFTTNEIREGAVYELVLTNYSGLYRYLQGDQVRVTGFRRGNAVLEILGRKGQMINVAGEKMDSKMLEDAALQFSVETGIGLFDYAVAVDSSRFPVCYVIYLEPDREVSMAERAGFSRRYDRILGEVNPDYADLRNLKSLGVPRTVCFRRGELARRKHYFNTAQNKPGQTILGNPLTVYKESEDGERT